MEQHNDAKPVKRKVVMERIGPGVMIIHFVTDSPPPEPKLPKPVTRKFAEIVSPRRHPSANF